MSRHQHVYLEEERILLIRRQCPAGPFASETRSIVLTPDETPERARVRIENELSAQGTAADEASWLFDEQTGELSFTVATDQADVVSGILGGIESFIEDIG